MINYGYVAIPGMIGAQDGASNVYFAVATRTMPARARARQAAANLGQVLLGAVVGVVIMSVCNLVWASRAIQEVEDRRERAAPAASVTGLDSELLDGMEELSPEIAAARDRWLSQLVLHREEPLGYQWSEKDLPLHEQDMPIP